MKKRQENHTERKGKKIIQKEKARKSYRKKRQENHRKRKGKKIIEKEKGK